MSRLKWFAGASLATALVGSLTMYESGDRQYLEPYQDIAGIWTVCDGITGKDVIRGKTYTPAECTALLEKAITTHLAGIEKCVPMLADRAPNVQFAHGHIAYNIGVGAWCGSSMARQVRAGGNGCEPITRWTFIGGKDCRLVASRCGGIWTRRQYERAVCEGRVNAFTT